ncbi:MAG: cation:proton antiporter [candidate division WOR-3 bacterium]|nr:cation:proton antiporter [candidate division WOR-3 bacterium]MCX7948277.1 cation:proton antiporter [candidate division WOR-3 bacterium]MDW8150956.1 cation:proton antiporter [candidate division WOR-3 bacterium]
MELLISIFFIFIVSVVFYALKVPLVLSYIISGFIASFFIHIELEIIEIINELAISVLLFFIGFEFSYNKIHMYIRQSFWGNFFTFTIFFVLGTTVAYTISNDLRSAFIFSLILYPSSSMVIVKILQSTKRLANLETPFIIITLILEDIFLGVFIGILKGSYFPILNAILVVLAIAINFKFRNKIKQFVKFLISLEREFFLVVTFFLIISSTFILDSPIGAFILGIVISDTYEGFFENHISVLREIIFIAFFFCFGYILKGTLLGNLNLLHISLAFVLLILSIFIKIINFFQIGNKRVIIRTLLTMAPRGEFSVFSVYFIEHQEIKIIAAVFVLFSVFLGSILSIYAKLIK